MDNNNVNKLITMLDKERKCGILLIQILIINKSLTFIPNINTY
mgnify:FL=1